MAEHPGNCKCFKSFHIFTLSLTELGKYSTDTGQQTTKINCSELQKLFLNERIR
jgi:hypothetical protein